MEKRIGAIAILIEDDTVGDEQMVGRINAVLSKHGSLILGRMGLPLRDKGVSVISLVIEGTTDQIGALTGQIGNLKGIKVKSVLTGYRS